MRRIVFSGFLMLLACGLFAQRQFQSYLDYIEKYKSLAIKEQYRHGIPASITMAQAIIESNAGESMIAVKGKNHFGIKCGSNWSGKTIYKDDDKRHDCFRSYSDVLDSYEDHSQFLKRDRYASLFKIPVRDYKAWARELKRLGYATDPNYANKLIKIIEDYGLDKLVYSNDSSDDDSDGANLLSSGSSYSDDDTSYPDKYTVQRNSYNDDNELYAETTNNGRKCYRLKRDANLHQVARALHKTNMKMLLYYNDMYKDNTLRAGTFVYVSKKRGKADERYRSYMVKEGDSMHSVAQQFGITLKALYKLNNLPYGTPAEDGMTLFLQ